MINPGVSTKKAKIPEQGHPLIHGDSKAWQPLLAMTGRRPLPKMKLNKQENGLRRGHLSFHRFTPIVENSPSQTVMKMVMRCSMIFWMFSMWSSLLIRSG